MRPAELNLNHVTSGTSAGDPHQRPTLRRPRANPAATESRGRSARTTGRGPRSPSHQRWPAAAIERLGQSLLSASFPDGGTHNRGRGKFGKSRFSPVFGGLPAVAILNEVLNPGCV